MELLSLKDVTISYGSVVAAQDVTFSVSEGDYLFIAGSNGSGKSTLLKGIIGLVPVRDGHIHSFIPKEEISYLSQTNRADRDFPATVWEIILSGTQRSGARLPFYSAADRENAETSMKKLGMEKFKNTQIGKLSGGQQQRVLLARALCKKPKLMLLDEPFAALDESISEELYGLYAELNRSGVTIVMASHDYRAISRYATRVMVMNNSRATFLGSVRDWRDTLWKQ